jgi:hypothetical protein
MRHGDQLEAAVEDAKNLVPVEVQQIDVLVQLRIGGSIPANAPLCASAGAAQANESAPMPTFVSAQAGLLGGWENVEGFLRTSAWSQRQRAIPYKTSGVAGKPESMGFR